LIKNVGHNATRSQDIARTFADQVDAAADIHLPETDVMRLKRTAIDIGVRRALLPFWIRYFPSLWNWQVVTAAARLEVANQLALIEALMKKEWLELCLTKM
jgi:hypothetical protein